jgi:ATP-dependent Clp protease adapter protein ClpS
MSLIIATLSLSWNNSCYSFLLPQPIQTTRQQLNRHHDTVTFKTTGRRNRFWGNEKENNFVLSSFTVSSQQHHRRHRNVVVFNGPSVIEIPTERTVTKEKESQQRYNHNDDETWEVRLYNDGLNTREHVSRSLVYVTGLSEYQAYSTMMQAHHNGMAVVGQYYYEIAEMFHDALKLEGIICDIVPVTNDA